MDGAQALFRFGRALKKFPALGEIDAPELDLAIEDLESARERVEDDLNRLDSILPDDYAALADVLADLQETLEHTRSHIDVATPELAALLRALDNR